MKLIIVIDRDDDIGRKTEFKTPIVGRKASIDAAIQLGITDPEDSDLNTIFGAIKIYDRMKTEGEDVEIAIISGDENVGVISDSRIAEQVDYLKKKFNATNVILVTDGSEDEFVIPIISSRFRVDAVNRIVVKQSKSLESTYYLIKKMFEDPKIAKATLSPLGIILLIFSIFSLLGLRDIGYGTIVFFIGSYLLLKAYGMDYAIEDYFSTIKNSLLEGRFSFIIYIVSLILVIVGIIQGLNSVWKLLNSPVAAGAVYLITTFIYGSLWWTIAGGVSIIVGRIFDAFIEKKPMRRYISMMFLLFSAGLIFWGGSVYIISSTEAYAHLRENALYYFMMALFGAFVSGIIGVLPFRHYGSKDSN
ncbi:DUF373 family protein [Geoglobus acetivorans]|uniref:DUF373 family protein n=1 Tax=Geoglobus acetivorans TaxID=565033 RepID=A0A0A7GCJ0_GEOAI|nr:hypothetical protein GACE_0699 [Geoglobus acetivorans]